MVFGLDGLHRVGVIGGDGMEGGKNLALGIGLWWFGDWREFGDLKYKFGVEPHFQSN